MKTWNIKIEPPTTESCGLTINNKNEKRKDEKHHKTKSKSYNHKIILNSVVVSKKETQEPQEPQTTQEPQKTETPPTLETIYENKENTEQPQNNTLKSGKSKRPALIKNKSWASGVKK